MFNIFEIRLIQYFSRTERDAHVSSTQKTITKLLAMLIDITFFECQHVITSKAIFRSSNAAQIQIIRHCILSVSMKHTRDEIFVH